jgi:VWFA-related protein
VFLALFVHGSIGQSDSAAPTLKVFSRETIVDVTVTDSHGNPVHGLTRNDFNVKEDGKPQPIRSFEEFGAAPPATTARPTLPPHVYTNLQPPPTTGAVNILLLDFVNTAALVSTTCCISYDVKDSTTAATVGPEDYALATRAQHLVKQEAMKYVAAMPPGTRVAVLGMTSRLHTLQGFTSDPSLLRAAIDTMQYDAEGHADTGPQLCTELSTRIRSTFEVLNQIAADTSSIKGKKNLIWFSVGVPALNNPSARPPCLPDYRTDQFKTYGLLAAAQIALYPVDARGVPPIPSYIPPRAVPEFLEKVGTEQLSMETWAEDTGGAAFYNSNDVAGEIAKAVDKGSNYYSISYVPPGPGYNDAHHSIRLTVDKPGIKLVYRQTYDAVDPATIKPAPGLILARNTEPTGPVDMRKEMGRSMPTSTALLFDVQVEPSTEPARPADPQVIGVLDTKLKGKPLTRYGFQYALPGRQIAFTSTPDGKRHGSLEFDLAAYDSDGNVVTSFRQALDLNLTADQTAQLAHSPFRYFQQLDLPPGALFLRIGVLDRTSNKVGTLEIPLTIPKH